MRVVARRPGVIHFGPLHVTARSLASLVSHLTAARARLHVLEVFRDASEAEGVAAQRGESIREHLPAHGTDVAVVET